MASVTKRGDTFRIMVSLGYDMAGCQIRKTTTFKAPEGVTPGKAEKLARAYAHDFEKKCQGLLNMNENMRFSELTEWYFSQIAPHKLKEATLYSTKSLIDLYVLPNIGHLKLKEINTTRMDALFNQLHKSGRTRKYFLLKDAACLPQGTWRPTARKAKIAFCTLKTALRGGRISKESAEKIAASIGKKLKDAFYEECSDEGLDPASITRIRTATSSIFSTALKKEIITKNPVTNATTPKMNPKKKLFLDANQCRQLLTILGDLTNPQVGVAISALLYTGTRVGELLALHWKDVDFENFTITIRHTLYRSKGQYKLSTPKTKSSERIITMPLELAELLKEQKEWQENQRQDVGSRWIERGAVFTGEYGEYMNRGYLNLSFKKLLSKHDFPDLHIHDLRHANASLLINAGVPVKVISEHLGHSNTLTTETIYAHVYNETRAKAASAISQVLTMNTEAKAI